jgi:hypothetical protein
VAHLDPPRSDQGAAVHRAGVTVADLGGLDRAVGGEVPPRHQIQDVAAVHVAPAHPPVPAPLGGRPEADAGRIVQPQRAWTDVALLQRWIGREVLFGEGLELGRLHLGSQALLVDLAVTGHADR